MDFWNDKDRGVVAGDFSKKEWRYLAKDSLARGIASFVMNLVMMVFAFVILFPFGFELLDLKEVVTRFGLCALALIVSTMFFLYSALLVCDYFRALKMSNLTAVHPRVKFESLHFGEELNKKWRFLYLVGGNALRFLTGVVALLIYGVARNYTIGPFDSVAAPIMLIVALLAFVCTYPCFGYVCTKGAEWSRETEDCEV